MGTDHDNPLQVVAMNNPPFFQSAKHQLGVSLLVATLLMAFASMPFHPAIAAQAKKQARCFDDGFKPCEQLVVSVWPGIDPSYYRSGKYGRLAYTYYGDGSFSIAEPSSSGDEL